MKFTVDLGPLADPIYMQLGAQAIIVKRGQAQLWERFRDALNMTGIHGIISPGELKKGRKRLFKLIEAHVQKLPNAS